MKVWEHKICLKEGTRVILDDLHEFACKPTIYYLLERIISIATTQNDIML